MRKHRRIVLAIHITPAGNLRPSYIDGRRRASRTLSDVTNKFSRRCLELRRLKTNTKRGVDRLGLCRRENHSAEGAGCDCRPSLNVYSKSVTHC